MPEPACGVRHIVNGREVSHEEFLAIAAQRFVSFEIKVFDPDEGKEDEHA